MTAFSEAVALFRAGETETAKARLEAERVRVEVAHGYASPAHASALRDQGRLLALCGDLLGSADRLGAAVDIAPIDEASARARLTCAMNLGDVLRQAGLLAEARTVLLTGLEERRAFYGDEHPGFAYGLESLASVQLEAGRLGEAQARVEQAVVIHRRHANPRIAAAVLLRARVYSARSEPLQLEEVGEWPAAWVAAICQEAVRRASDLDSAEFIPVMIVLGTVLRAHGRERPGLQVVINTLAPQANKRHRERVESARTAMDRAIALRDHGFFLADAGHHARAAAALIAAVASADRSGNEVLAGQVRIGAGVLEHHAGHPELAEALLSRGLQALAPSERLHCLGTLHLGVLGTQHTCGCDRMAYAWGRAVHTP